jgi:branched-chain amino acid transport system ATP-binding protein
MALLEVENLVKKFGGIVALDGVDLTVKSGAKYVIIGPNGAGKTTLFNCITGYHVPTSGTVRFQSKDITGEPDYRNARRGIRRTFQEVAIFDELTVTENIDLSSHETSTHEIMNTLNLLNIRDKYGEELTLFERKRVALALALDGDLLLLDEVFSGLNPTEKPAMIEYIDKIAQEKTLLMIEHDIGTAFNLADRIIVLDSGKVIKQEPPEKIMSDPDIQDQYLGGSTI